MPPRPGDRTDPTRTAPNTVQVTSSNTTVAATSARDVVVLTSPSLSNTTVTGFTLGQDVLRIEDAATVMAALAARITLRTDADGVSTDIVADAGTSTVHTIAVLKGVLATDLQQVVQLAGAHPTELALTVSNQTVAATAAADHIEIKSLDQTGDVVTGFALGVDRLDLGHIDRSRVTLATNGDGVSTDLVVDAGKTGSHVLVTLKSVLTADLTQLLGAEPAKVDLAASNTTVTATAGTDLFVITSLTLSGDTIVGFTLGQDRLALVGGLDPSRLSLAKDADGTSTDVIVDAGASGAHTLVKLAGVLTADLDAVFLHHGGPFGGPGGWHG
jgi:hypothetical protein